IFASRKLYLLLTRALCRRPPLEVLEAALGGGVELVQLREKPFSSDALPWIEEVIEVCDAFEAPVVINDRPDLALASGASLVHFGQEDLASYWPGALKTRKFGLGISTHDLAELERARLEEPDYIGVGNCFPTETKGLDTATEPAVIRELCQRSPVPAFAIGGINAGNLPSLLELGVCRIAVSSCILDAEDPEQSARELRIRLDRGA
ncbi:MAG: thiamine phosphate synthase, partial [Planctomycetota bacterium]